MGISFKVITYFYSITVMKPTNIKLPMFGINSSNQKNVKMVWGEALFHIEINTELSLTFQWARKTWRSYCIGDPISSKRISELQSISLAFTSHENTWRGFAVKITETKLSTFATEEIQLLESQYSNYEEQNDCSNKTFTNGIKRVWA